MTRLLADRYELCEVVGAGGVARVHRAVDRHLERDVAVKVLDDEQARSADPSGRDRFLREARSAARLQHPHLVTIYDAGEDAGELFLVMELVDGQSLAALIGQRAPLPVDEAVSIAVQILDGLSAVHADGVIHRDVKPSNVLVDAAGRARLTDFGIAKRLDDIEQNLTSAGMVVGTPTYLAPEQATGDRLGVATDVYLVGLVLDEMLTGRRPTGSALDPRRVRSDVPAGVADAVVRATDADPKRRFQSATDMIEALRAVPPRVATLVFPAAAAAVPVAAPMAGHTTVMPGNHPIVEAEPTRAIAPVLVDPVEAGPRFGPRMSGWWLLAAAAIVLALVVGLLMVADAAPDKPGGPALSTPGTSVPLAPVASAPPTTAIVVSAPQNEGGNDQGNGHSHGKKNKKGDG
jgi:eukaryotic-like serine/threonine-protein kinase